MIRALYYYYAYNDDNNIIGFLDSMLLKFQQIRFSVFFSPHRYDTSSSAKRWPSEKNNLPIPCHCAHHDDTSVPTCYRIYKRIAHYRALYYIGWTKIYNDIMELCWKIKNNNHNLSYKSTTPPPSENIIMLYRILMPSSLPADTPARDCRRTALEYYRDIIIL